MALLRRALRTFSVNGPSHSRQLRQAARALGVMRGTLMDEAEALPRPPFGIVLEVLRGDEANDS